MEKICIAIIIINVVIMAISAFIGAYNEFFVAFAAVVIASLIGMFSE